VRFASDYGKIQRNSGFYSLRSQISPSYPFCQYQRAVPGCANGEQCGENIDEIRHFAVFLPDPNEMARTMIDAACIAFSL
jgi:hypothetical protein